ncbi:MAG: ribosome-associated translation inhibitor RaiA [Acidobacteria bacterium]|nr:MAG: ribosome-associated translation inhibitor RaiA [Acidobacteriota bacterium]
MKFEYSGRHIDVTPALQSHVEDHFKRIEHIFRNKPIKAHVIIEVERGRHRSEIIVYWRNDVLTATTRNSDMYVSLSQSIDKIEKQALKLKNKVIDRSHRAARVGTVGLRTAELAPAPSNPRIISARRYAVKPVMPEEAALMLNGEANSFLVFRNAETERISVIFKRKDGNFGLIEP